MEQPLEVWRVMELVAELWTPSMMSISPLAGQLGPTSLRRAISTRKFEVETDKKLTKMQATFHSQ